ncbi:MAG: fructose-6-phosphate aldolase [Acidobacteria bacterium]|nr:fructose-6-phosphate aldolase [Acidobacteriota bacterium]
MKFFIDTANLEEIKEASQMGLIDGVTTNPSLIAKEGVTDHDSHMKKICELVDGPISAEVVSTDFDGMMKEAKHLAALHKNIVIKLPMTMDGIKATKACTEAGIKTNVTLVFQPIQALLAAKAGATFVSPFVGRIDDIGRDGMQIIEEIRIIFDNYGFETQILTASIRHPHHVLRAALMGSDVATIPFKVIKQLIKHPLTDIGLENFLKDHENLKKK